MDARLRISGAGSIHHEYAWHGPFWATPCLLQAGPPVITRPCICVCPLALSRRAFPRSCIIDGEAVACDGNGMPSFDRTRYRGHDASGFLYAFDLLQLNGRDLRRELIEDRKATLANIVAKAGPALLSPRGAAGPGRAA